MERQKYLLKPLRLWLGLIYFFGALGLWWDTSRPLFLMLTPYTLLLGALALLALDTGLRFKNIALLFLVWMAGFGVEVLGVHTGWVFGQYQYGQVLGWQLFDVPLVIGLNWTILLYVIFLTLRDLDWPVWVQIVVGACLLVATDILIEPVATALDFWQWETPGSHALFVAPLQNYIAWGLFSALILTVFHWLKPIWKNPLATRYWGYQGMFFALYLLLSLIA